MDPYYFHHFNLTDSPPSYINEIDTCTLWDDFNQVYPEIIQIEVPKKLKDIKIFPMNALMAELPNLNLLPMKSVKAWIDTPWFYIIMTLVVILLFGYCIKQRRTIKMLGLKCLLSE